MPIANKNTAITQMQEVSSAIQIQGKKLAGPENAIQTKTVIQI